MAVAVIVIVTVTMRDSGFDLESLSDFEKCHGDWTSWLVLVLGLQRGLVGKGKCTQWHSTNAGRIATLDIWWYCRYSSVGFKYIFCFASLVVSMGVSAVREGRHYHVFCFSNSYASFFQAILATAAWMVFSLLQLEQSAWLAQHLCKPQHIQRRWRCHPKQRLRPETCLKKTREW